MFRISFNHWGKRLAVLTLLVTLLIVDAAAPTPMAADDNHQSDDVMVFKVSTVDELYDAVYDEVGVAREQVEIRLAPGEYQLNPSDDLPNNGRLHLGLGTDLIGPLVLAVDEQEIPLAIDEAPNPEVEAIINFGGLTSFFGYGAIVVDGGTVEGVTLVGDGATPGIEIATSGLVRGNRVENSSLGLRIRASATDPVHGLVEGNLVQNGYFIGLSIIAAQPLVAEVDCNLNGTIDFGESAEPGASNTGLQAEVYRNRFEDGQRGLQVLGSFGGSFNAMNVMAADNVVATNSEGGVLVIGGWDNFVAPDCIKAVERRDAVNNQVIVKSQGLRVEDSPTGILVAGSLKSTVAPVSDHRVHAEFDDTTLVGTDTGLRLLGEDLAHVGQDAPPGERSRVDLVIVGTKAETPAGESTTVSSVVGNCRDGSIVSCSNIVTVAGPAQTFAQENPGLDGDDFLGHYSDAGGSDVTEEAVGEAELPGRVKTTVNDLGGLWLNRTGFPEGVAYLQFQEEGSYRVAGTLYLENHPSEVGQFQLEGTSLIFLPSDDSLSCAGQAGRYQVELTEHGHLRFQVQDDPCRTRTRVNEGLFVRLLTAEDLVGIWDSGEEFYLQFNEAGTYRAANSFDSLESAPSEAGSYQLQQGAYPAMLTLTTNNESPLCQGQISTYEAKLVKGQLQFELQEDTCRDRAIDLAAISWA